MKGADYGEESQVEGEGQESYSSQGQGQVQEKEVIQEVQLAASVQLSPQQQLECRRLAAFEDPRVLNKSLLSNGYYPGDEVRELVAMIRQDTNPKLKLQAIRELRAMRTAALEHAGYYIRASKTVSSPDGTTMVLSTSSIKAALLFNKDNETELEPSNEGVPNENEEQEQNDSPNGPAGGSPAATVHKPPHADSGKLHATGLVTR
jgi:hypothetical protein